MSALCPSNAVNHIRFMSWTFYTTKDHSWHSDPRDFCVIVGDNAEHLIQSLKDRALCSKEKVVVAIPGSTLDKVFNLEILFFAGWRAGKLDIAIVVSDRICRVFSYVPSKGRDNYYNSTTAVLTHTWPRKSSCPSDDSRISYFQQNTISNLNLGSIDVYIEAGYIDWDPLIDFLQVAMNATFNINRTSRFGGGYPGIPSTLPRIFVSSFLVRPSTPTSFVLPPFFAKDDVVYAVPRKLTSSIEWFRLVNELSDNVWYCLIVALVSSVGIVYMFAKGRKDFIYVVLLNVQPLLQHSSSGRFLPGRGRMFFTVWLLCSFVLQSSYVCKLLSKLTVPSNEDAIKSFDDLVKSSLPVHARIRQNTMGTFRSSPYFNQIKDKLVLHDFDKEKLSEIVQKDSEVAYIFKTQKAQELLAHLSYRLLPEVIYTSVTVPVRMTRPTPYEGIFTTAMMRSIAAGAMDKISQEYNHRVLLRRGWSSNLDEKGPRQLPLRSFFSLLVVWSSGCALAFLVFILEYCSKKFPPKTR